MAMDQEKDAEKGPEPPLEEALDRLEAIVGKLESGEVDLEKSIDLYVEGKELGQRALKRLDALERRIQIVARDDGQSLEVKDFQ